MQVPDQLGGAHPGGLLEDDEMGAGRQVPDDPGDPEPLDLELGFFIS